MVRFGRIAIFTLSGAAALSVIVVLSITKYSFSASPIEFSNSNITFLHEVNKSYPGDDIYLHARATVNGFPVIADVPLQMSKGQKD